MNDIEILSHLFRKYKSEDPVAITVLQGGGSGRRYYRLVSEASGSEAGWSCIGVTGASKCDFKSFVALSGVFRENAVNVPEVFISSEKYGSYLQEDLGSMSLFDLISREGESARVTQLMEESVRNLAKLQEIPEKEWEGYVEYPPFSCRQIKWDLNYFKYEYLLPSGRDFNEDLLEDDFMSLTSELWSISEGLSGFMYRDCQSRNVMICDDAPWWIDFQGGRRGPGVYDLVSLLWQAKASFTEGFRMSMIGHYQNEKLKTSSLSIYSDQKVFLSIVLRFAFFRTLQVLGAYGLRGLVERKAHFLESIPYALKNLKNLLEAGVADQYPELKCVCEGICQDKRFVREESHGLKIEVFSFSYKKGYPADFSGNGGGFMFDCRGMHNPGRYKEYKCLTGRDKPVIDFLESKGEVQKFVEVAFSMIEDSVKTYIRRGFTNLQIGFGCTGGQHRSVYCAERMARLLRERFPEVTVNLEHREHPTS